MLWGFGYLSGLIGRRSKDFSKRYSPGCRICPCGSIEDSALTDKEFERLPENEIIECP